MADPEPGGQSRGEPRPPGCAGVSKRAVTQGYWFPLLLFGGLAALSLPLSVLASPRPPTGLVVLTRDIYPTVTQAMYLGGGFATGPFPFPLGWYWAGALVAGLLLTAAWYPPPRLHPAETNPARSISSSKIPSHRPGFTLWPAVTARLSCVVTNHDHQAVAVQRPAAPRET